MFSTGTEDRCGSVDYLSTTADDISESSLNGLGSACESALRTLGIALSQPIEPRAKKPPVLDQPSPSTGGIRAIDRLRIGRLFGGRSRRIGRRIRRGRFLFAATGDEQGRRHKEQG